jgi:anti-anti-sigma factor
MPVLSRGADGTKVRIHGTVPIVEVIGDLDLRDLPAFEAALHHASQSASQEIIVSLAETEYFNSGGIRVIMRLAGHLEQENRHLLLVAPRDRVPRRLLDIVYMTSDLLPFESIEEALAAITN